jgi:cysteine desulfurase
MRKPVYLDHNATTPVDPLVLAEMVPFFTQHFGNAASRTHAFGWVAADAVDKARKQVACLIGSEDQEIIFTSGSTEAINLGIKGVFDAYHKKGKHLITVSTEHKAVLDTCLALEKRGAEITILPVDREGKLDLKDLEEAIRADTILVCIMHANNETGVIHPVEAIAEIVNRKGSLYLCDATQAAGKVQINVKDTPIALLALSAHKLYGPKGAGALFVRRKNPRVTLTSQIDGGGHERGLRSGTLNVPGIVGLGKACELAQTRIWEDGEQLSKWRTKLEQFLLDLGGVFVNGSQRDRLPNTTNLSFSGIRAFELISKLPDFAVSTGSACTSAVSTPSHVLKAMNVTDIMAQGSVRFSLGRDNSTEQIDDTIREVSKAVTDLRAQQ